MANSHRNTPTQKWYQHWIARNLILAGILSILILLTAILSLNLITRHGRELIVPDFSNLSVAEASAMAQRLHLQVEVTDSVYVKRMPRGHITRQRPTPGSAVKKDRKIRLTINSVMPRLASVPDLINLSLRQAKTELQAQGLHVGKLIYTPDIASNNVLAQQYQGIDIEPGTTVESETHIDLVLGLNEYDQFTFIPDLRGYRYQAAKDQLLDHFLNLGRVRFDETVLNYTDSLNAVVYRVYPTPSDTLSYPMGTPIHIELTLNEEKLNPETQVL